MKRLLLLCSILFGGYTLFAQNVGIGTSDPTGKFTVYDGLGLRTEITIRTSDNTKSQGIAFQNSGTAYTWNIYRKDVGSNRADLMFANGADATITNLVDVVTFQDGGNVGIGDTDPTAKLNVVGPIRASDLADEVEYLEMDHGGSNAFINYTGDGDIDIRYAGDNILSLGYTTAGNGTADGRIEVYANETISSHIIRGDGTTVFNEGSRNIDFRIESNNNANMFFVDASTDKIGIGLSDPETELEVEGVAAAKSFIYQDPRIRIGNGTNTTTRRCDETNAGATNPAPERGYAMTGLAAYDDTDRWQMAGEPSGGANKVYCVELTEKYLDVSSAPTVASMAATSNDYAEADCGGGQTVAIGYEMRADGDNAGRIGFIDLYCRPLVSSTNMTVSGDGVVVNGAYTESQNLWNGASCPAGSFVHKINVKRSGSGSNAHIRGNLQLFCKFVKTN